MITKGIRNERQLIEMLADLMIQARSGEFRRQEIKIKGAEGIKSSDSSRRRIQLKQLKFSFYKIIFSDCSYKKHFHLNHLFTLTEAHTILCLLH